MKYYGSGGTAIQEQNSAGFSLLALDTAARDMGVGKRLALQNIHKAMQLNLSQVIIYSTKTMQTAWTMYELSF